MLERYKKLFALLDRRERRRFYLVMLVMVAVTCAELVGLSALFVLLNVLSEPETITTNTYLAWAYNSFGFTDIFPFQITLSALTFGAIIFGLVVKAVGNFSMIRYAVMRGYSLSTRLLEAYLHQPYVWFLERNSAEINKNVLGEVNALTNRMLTPSLLMMGNILRAGTIIIFLLLVDPLVAVLSALFIGGGYVLIYLKLRKLLARIGKDLLAANKGRYQISQEATGGVKEVKLLSLEKHYVKRFSEPARLFARSTALSRLLNTMPRFALEAMTFAVLLTVIMVMLVQNDGNLAAAIPTLGIFVFAIMRLLPALQNIYGALASIRSADPILDLIHQDYMSTKRNAHLKLTRSKSDIRLELTRELELRDISFSYPNTEKTSVNGLSFKIPANHKIGIVGGTGAGKTTMVDLMLGLLAPNSGEILVDGEVLSRDNMQAWRRTLGYVPQTIYLTDSTLAENIAFGMSAKDIDMPAVERAARIASLHDFVMGELPKGYQTMVGERGVRLSGGQRQRIGIARALYHDPDLLIMDEATSALDNLTERAIMDAMHNIGDDKTIIMIAHRLTTVEACDTIIMLEHGKISASGTYSELIEKSDTFKRMAGE